MKILLLNGPNLNWLGKREPDVYGHATLADIERDLREFLQSKSHTLHCCQSNHAGILIDFLQEQADAAYAIINPGGLTHTSVALRDAFAGTAVPFIEVHISNVHAREEFRHHSYLSAIAKGVIVGCGVFGYRLAAELVVNRLES
jgi:3-dehydroquinate dehydratase-2